jgi:glucose 1-dehydrogenase
MDLKGKAALVTGAGTGIGKGIALALAAYGAKVAVNYFSSADGAQDTKARIEESDGEAMVVRADISDREQVNAMARKVVDRYGSIDILVNNSAYQPNIQLMDYDEKTYDRVMDTNLKGYFLCTQAVLPFMKQQGFGRIINISSVHAKRPFESDPVYSMTKGAIKMLTRECAIEFGRYGITVNAIEPGGVLVEKMMGSGWKRRTADKKFDRHRVFPVGRMGLPSDIGHFTAYLASDESEHISGSCIRIDGGSMLIV